MSDNLPYLHKPTTECVWYKNPNTNENEYNLPMQTEKNKRTRGVSHGAIAIYIA
jgi:hypothetical protein